jgi:hypothetical protein
LVFSDQMKIVFSDICGVLNNTPYISREGKRGEVAANALDPECVQNLSTLCTAAPACVVLTSAWRQFLDLDQFRKLLTLKGFAGKVLSVTPASTSGNLEDDVQLWLTSPDWDETCAPEGAPRIEEFCVISPSNHVGSLHPLLVQTSFDTGLTTKDVLRAFRLLSC